MDLLSEVLRFEPNFGVWSLFLCLYELVVSAVKGSVGGGLVTNEEAEVFGDGKSDVGAGLVDESFSLEAEGAKR